MKPNLGEHDNEHLCVNGSLDDQKEVGHSTTLLPTSQIYGVGYKSPSIKYYQGFNSLSLGWRNQCIKGLFYKLDGLITKD